MITSILDKVKVILGLYKTYKSQKPLLPLIWSATTLLDSEHTDNSRLRHGYGGTNAIFIILLLSAQAGDQAPLELV
jgi:hypothetical protein